MDGRRTAVRGIIWQDGKLLAVRHKTHDGGEADFWAIPGGGLDMGEPITAGVVREMVEETGITPQVGRLLFMQQFQFTHHNGKTLEHFEFFFHITNPEDYATIDLGATSHGMLELTCCEFIDPKTEYILPAFLQTIDIERHIQSNEPVLIHNELQ